MKFAHPRTRIFTLQFPSKSPEYTGIGTAVVSKLLAHKNGGFVGSELYFRVQEFIFRFRTLFYNHTGSELYFLPTKFL